MFSYIVLLSAVLLASCAAWFSISGIAQLFAGAGLAAGLMAGALELGKIVGVSFLYRYRSIIPKLLKTYLWIGTMVLMLITSVGIYGYLASAYATSATGIQEKENQITLYTSQQTTLEQNIKRLSDRSIQLQTLRTQQENRVDELIRLGRSTTTQQRIIRDQDTEINKLQSSISTLSKQRDSLAMLSTNTTNSISTTGKLGTFYYVAKTLNVPLDTIVTWFIVLLVLVFDPMSIALFVSYNIIVNKKQRNLTTVTNLDSASDIALDNVHVAIEQKKQDFDTTELPYYMQPGYDWNTDTRWHGDAAARGFKGNLGY